VGVFIRDLPVWIDPIRFSVLMKKAFVLWNSEGARFHESAMPVEPEPAHRPRYETRDVSIEIRRASRTFASLKVEVVVTGFLLPEDGFVCVWAYPSSMEDGSNREAGQGVGPGLRSLLRPASWLQSHLPIVCGPGYAWTAWTPGSGPERARATAQSMELSTLLGSYNQQHGIRSVSVDDVAVIQASVVDHEGLILGRETSMLLGMSKTDVYVYP
jgi:hypothetical protein